jgi:DNA primase catalytic subunit
VDKINENYSDIHIVFSGKKGFHIHVWDFDVRDWTHYNERNPIKSHEVARYIYTKHIKAGTGGFDDSHFRLSCDPMRVVTFPGSLNGKTGLVCSYLGKPTDFESLSISDILFRSRAMKYFFNTSFEPMNHSHPEPVRAMTLCAKTGGGEYG